MSWSQLVGKQEQGYGVRNQIDWIKWRDVLWLCLMMKPRVIKSREKTNGWRSGFDL